MIHTSRHDASFHRALPALLVALILAGGGQPPWALASVIGILGLTLIIRPIQYAPGKGSVWLAGILLAWTFFSAIAPAFGETAFWRQSLTSAAIPLPVSNSPYPLLAIESVIYQFAALAAIFWICDLKISRAQREESFLLLGCALTGLAAFTLWANSTGLLYPLAPEAQVFSFFPNKNQSALIYALGGGVAVCLALEALRKFPWRAFAALLAFLILFLAVLVSHSRAALILGLLYPIGLFLAGRLNKSPTAQPSRLPLSFVAAVLVLCSALAVMAGSPLLQRFDFLQKSEVLHQMDFRIPIYQDCLRLIADTPLRGIGAGSFEFIFPFYQIQSIAPPAIRHPESDWFWITVNWGLPGLIGTVILLISLAAGVGSFRDPRSRLWRFAALGGALTALIHSTIDVPLHRPATFLLALYLFALGRSEGAWRNRKSLPAIASYACGVCLLLSSAGLLADAFGLHQLREPSRRTHYQTRVLGSLAAGQTEEASRLATDWSQQHPLDWRAWYLRAESTLRSTSSLAEARKHFLRARIVAPHDFRPPFLEGQLWLRLGAYGQAAAAWREALSRPHDPSERLFLQMMQEASPQPAFFPFLESLSWSRPEHHQLFLKEIRSTQFAEAWRKHLEQDPALAYFGNPQTNAFLARYAEIASPAEGLRLFANNPALSQRFPSAHARALARNGRIAEATQILLERLPPPELPKLEIRESSATLEGYFRQDPSDLVAGLRAFTAAMHEQDTARALRLLELLRQKQKTTPAIEQWYARLATAEGQYEQAWIAWKNFLDLTTQGN